MAEEEKHRRAGLGTLLLVVLAAGAGYWFAHTHPTSTAVPEVKQGVVTSVGAGGDEFTYRPDGGGSAANVSFGVAPHVPWLDPANMLHIGTVPPCLAPSSKGEHVSFGVVNFKTPTGTGLPDVVWVKCA